ncbi:MAG: PGF-pre-PGF domain-containing protein [Thaumarchaeota archaeon]|nr:PGF-pre-PGF domain-containing protein [Nitrososphaerota archaeon]
MNKKNFMYFFFLSCIFFLASSTLAVDLCSWRGYANKSGTLVNTTDYITVVGAKSAAVTIFTNGYYTADVEKSAANISFKICGVAADQGEQVFICPVTTLNILNLSITLSSSGASCTYSCGCSSGHCCSGATEYTDGTGTGTCQSACTATTTTTVAGAGPGGGGTISPTATTTAATTATTTTTAAPQQETEKVTKIENGTSATFNITKSDTLKVESIEVEVKNTVSNVEVTVKESSLPAGANVAIAADQGAVYKYLEITKTNVQDADINKVKIKFKVEKSWATANNIDPATIALQRLVGNDWTTLTTSKVSEDSTYYYFEAESPGLSVFAITGKKLPTPTTTVITTTTTAVVPPVVPGVSTGYMFVIFLVVLIAIALYFVLKSRKKKIQF